VRHYQVTVRDGEYDIGYRTFSSLKEFVDHFSSQPVIAGNSGRSFSTHVYLKLTWAYF